jgi:hypothetical protein
MASFAAALCKPLVILSEAKNLLRIAVGFKILRRFAPQNDRLKRTRNARHYNLRLTVGADSISARDFVAHL